MGLDLSLGYMLAMGIMLDVLPEAVALAAAMSATKSPWRIAHPMIHTDPDEHNGIAVGTFVSRHHFDANQVLTVCFLLACPETD
jgi:hypothetical protein